MGYNITELKEGMEVTVALAGKHEAQLTGEVYREEGLLMVGGIVLAHPSGAPGVLIEEVLNARPTEPIGTAAVVQDRDGDVWVRLDDGMFYLSGDLYTDLSWERLSGDYGPVTVAFEGVTR